MNWEEYRGLWVKIPFVSFTDGKQLGGAAPAVDPRRCDARRRLSSRVDEDHELLFPSSSFSLYPVLSLVLSLFYREHRTLAIFSDESPAFKASPSSTN